MEAKSHDSFRTISEWVLWAQNEGYTDIIELSGGEGPAKMYARRQFVSFHFILLC